MNSQAMEGVAAIRLGEQQGLGTIGGAASASLAPEVGDFGRMVQQGVAAVNRQLLVSQGDLQRLATGNAQNLHQIMIRLEESRLSFQLLMQVRNRLLEAYQELMRMQV